jgi:hypothetical protein
MVLEKIFGPNRDEVAVKWRSPLNEEQILLLLLFFGRSDQEE